jgi:hypothetical protein
MFHLNLCKIHQDIGKSIARSETAQNSDFLIHAFGSAIGCDYSVGAGCGQNPQAPGMGDPQTFFSLDSTLPGLLSYFQATELPLCSGNTASLQKVANWAGVEKGTMLVAI